MAFTNESTGFALTDQALAAPEDWRLLGRPCVEAVCPVGFDHPVEQHLPRTVGNELTDESSLAAVAAVAAGSDRFLPPAHIG